MKSYDVAYVLDVKTTNRYEINGIDFEIENGINGENLPVPAVYIINKKCVIDFRHFDQDRAIQKGYR